MIERIIDAEYTAEKQEGTVPPCENSVVEVSATYQKEFTLEEGDSLSDIDTTDLMEGSTAIDGDTTYEWDGTQWVSSGGGMSVLMITWDLDTNLLDKTFNEIADHIAGGGVAYITDGDPAEVPPFVEYMLVGGVNVQEGGYQVWDSRGKHTWEAATINDYPEYTEI